MKVINWILSIFNAAVTECEYCGSSFKGSLQAGRYWVTVIHHPNCRAAREAMKWWYDSIRHS